MNALTRDTIRIARPTPAEPIPSLAGTPGLKLLMSEVPRDLAPTLTGAQMAEVAETCRIAIASLTSATTLEIAAVIEGLALHFPVLRRTEGENRIVTRQWVEDLEGYPVDLLAEAARLWRNSSKDKFPTPGQFKAEVQPILTFRKTIGRWAAELLELITA